jgi:exodeoxyribonuclease VII small subunit
MADEKFTFEQARIRLEEIAAEARKKDTSLERSLDLLEEGVRLANICTELVDHTDLDAGVVVTMPDAPVASEDEDAGGDEPVAPVDGPRDTPAAADGAGEEEAGGFDEADDEVDEPSEVGDED